MKQTEQTQSTKKEISRPKLHGKTGDTVASYFSAKGSAIPEPLETNDSQMNVVKWGKKNFYPYFLNYLSKNNAMHSGILRSKVFYTVSGGLDYEGEDESAWNDFFQNGANNPNDNNLNGLMYDASLDYEKSNMFCFKVIMSAVDPSKIRRIVEIPFEQVRHEITEDKDGNTILTGNIKVSKDWSDSSNTPKTLKPYIKGRKQKEFFVIHQEQSGQALNESDGKTVNHGIYPDPPYGGAITAIDSGIQIDKFNNSEIYNGFSLGTILNLNNGVPANDEKKKALIKDIRDQATGAYNSGGVMILTANGKDREASVTSMNGNDLPDRYMNAKKGTDETILRGHSVTVPQLFGFSVQGSLGNSTELETGYLIMQSNYFTYRRNALLSVLNWIAKEIQGLTGEITFNEPRIDFEKNIEEDGNAAAKALNEMSPLVATKVLEKMTDNEVRALGKLPPLEGGDTLKDSTPQTTFTKEDTDKILERLKKYGRAKENTRELYSLSINDSHGLDDESFLNEFKKQTFGELTDEQLQVLIQINLMNGFNEIRKALDMDGKKLAGIYKALQTKGMISDEGEVLDLGASEVAASDIQGLEVLFEYRKRDNAPKLVPGGKSREFCEQLITLDRLYTREEINLISGVEGYDVFRYRGGWYHDPNTGKNNPGCRHEWAQVVTFI